MVTRDHYGLACGRVCQSSANRLQQQGSCAPETCTTGGAAQCDGLHPQQKLQSMSCIKGGSFTCHRALCFGAAAGASRWRLTSVSIHHMQHVGSAARNGGSRSYSRFKRSVSENREVTVTSITATQLVQEACNRHQTAPTASAALGRLLLGTLLMAAFREEEATTQVTLKGDGTLGHAQAIATSDGQVKGRVGCPAADPPLRADGKLNVSAAVGSGFLAVVRNHPLQQTPYTGMTQIVSGEVAEDLAAYLAESEQQNCALGLGVSIGRDAEVLTAGGFLVQVLPFASEETLSALEANIAALGSISEQLQQGINTRQLCGRLLGSLAPAAEEDGFSVTPRYGPCESSDLQQRMKRAIATLPRDEILDIVQQEGKLEVTCEFCKEAYTLDHEELLAGMKS